MAAQLWGLTNSRERRAYSFKPDAPQRQLDLVWIHSITKFDDVLILWFTFTAPGGGAGGNDAAKNEMRTERKRDAT
jgi:hypothetical protein